jgi:hypothetical protein
MPPPVFEPTIPASERPQTDALDRAALSEHADHKFIDFVSTGIVTVLLRSGIVDGVATCDIDIQDVARQRH